MENVITQSLKCIRECVCTLLICQEQCLADSSVSMMPILFLAVMRESLTSYLNL